MLTRRSALKFAAADASPRWPIASVASGFCFLDGHDHGDDGPEVHAQAKLTVYLYADGSGKINVFPIGYPRDEPTDGSVRLPAPLGAELYRALMAPLAGPGDPCPACAACGHVSSMCGMCLGTAFVLAA